jgi:flavodoxin
MVRAVILYAPKEDAIVKTAGIMEKAFDKKVFSVKSTDAQTGSITSIAAADLIVVGTGKGPSGPYHPDFQEIVRALEGINLAGRVCAFFAVNSDQAIDEFRAAFKATGAKVFTEPLLVKSEPQADQVKSWIRKLTSFYKEGDQ